jgi:hypothetical protein
MKATEAKLLDFLKKSPQFVIPIYLSGSIEPHHCSIDHNRCTPLDITHVVLHISVKT